MKMKINILINCGVGLLHTAYNDYFSVKLA